MTPWKSCWLDIDFIFAGAITKILNLSHSKKSQSLISHRILVISYNTAIKGQLQVKK